MEMEYKIIEKVGKISPESNGWAKELNFISWNNREPVYDIRSWNEGNQKMGKGVTLTIQELKSLRHLLNDMDL